MAFWGVSVWGKVKDVLRRVVKCHEYDKYICVKIFVGWGKKSGIRCNLAEFSLFWEDLHNYARFLCIK